MTRERWLVLAGCLALLRLLPACGNACLNPQPEPPGGGCHNESTTGTAHDSGRGSSSPEAGRADANADRSTDAGADGGANPIDAGVDQVVEHSDVMSDAPDAKSDDPPVDAAGDPGLADVAVDSPHDDVVTSSDVTEAGKEDVGTADAAASDAPNDGAEDAPEVAEGDAHTPD
jgi:hypothetical protein